MDSQLGQQQQQQEHQQQRAADLAHFVTAKEAVARLSVDVLQQLLSMVRGLPNSGDPSTSGSINSSSNASGSTLLQGCQHLVALLVAASPTVNAINSPGAANAALTTHHTPSGVHPLPVEPAAQCCKVLQDCLRLATASAAAASRDVLWAAQVTGSSIMGSVAEVVGGVKRQDDTPAVATSGAWPLAPCCSAAPGVVSGP
jgi:hypothetical protein